MSSRTAYGYLFAAALFAAVFLLRIPQQGAEDVSADMTKVGETELYSYNCDLNLGRIPNDQEFIKTVRVKNTTTQRISISAIVAECSCTKVDPIQLIVPGLGEAAFTLNVSASQFGQRADETFSIGLKVYVDDGTVGVLRLTGVAFAPIRVSGSAIVFSKAVPLGSSAVSQPFRVTIAPEVEALRADLDSNLGRIRKIAEVHGNVSEYCVELAKGCRVGSFELPVSFTVDVPARGGSSTLVVPCVGTRESCLEYWPETITFSADLYGDAASLSQDVQLRSNSDAKLTDISLSFDHHQLDAALDGPDARGVFSVTVKPKELSTLGATMHDLLITGLNDRNRSPFEVRIPVTVFVFPTASE